METQTVAGAVLIGFLLRLALPVALTIFIVWALRKLDARWQAQGERQLHAQIALATAQRPSCWEQRGCSPEQRAVCPVCQQSDLPCWLVKRDSKGQLQQACLNCDVFLNAAAPVTA